MCRKRTSGGADQRREVPKEEEEEENGRIAEEELLRPCFAGVSWSEAPRKSSSRKREKRRKGFVGYFRLQWLTRPSSRPSQSFGSMRGADQQQQRRRRQLWQRVSESLARRGRLLISSRPIPIHPVVVVGGVVAFNAAPASRQSASQSSCFWLLCLDSRKQANSQTGRQATFVVVANKMPTR